MRFILPAGLVRPGMVGPGLVRPGMVGPGLVRPGMVGPGLVRPGIVRQVIARQVIARWLAICVIAIGLVGAGGMMVSGARLQAQTSAESLASAGEKTTPVSTVPEKKQEVKDESDEYMHSPMVAKLGSMMGMSTEHAATAFTVFNFLILAVAVGYMLLKTLPKTFRTRSSSIQKQLVDARTATEEATARLSSVEERLAKLDDQIAAMRTQAEADSARDEQRIKASLEDERAKIVTAAEMEIENATTMARREIQRYAVELAIEQAARKLVVSAETDRLLVESFAHQLGSGQDAEKRNEN